MGTVINQRGRKSYFFYQKNLWNCNVMKFEIMREEKTISSLMATGRKWFFPPSWSQISWHYNFTSFSDKRHNFFFPIGLLMCPLGNGNFQKFCLQKTIGIGLMCGGLLYFNWHTITTSGTITHPIPSDKSS